MSAGCADQTTYKSPVAGTVTAITPTGTQVFPGPMYGQIARVQPTTGPEQVVAARYFGTVSGTSVQVGQQVTVGQTLATVVSADEHDDHKEVIVGEGVTWTSKAWTTDFSSNTSQSVDVLSLIHI